MSDKAVIVVATEMTKANPRIDPSIVSGSPMVPLSIHFCNMCGKNLAELVDIVAYYNAGAEGYFPPEHSEGMSVHHCGELKWYCDKCLGVREFLPCIMCGQRPGHPEKEPRVPNSPAAHPNIPRSPKTKRGKNNQSNAPVPEENRGGV